MNKRRLQAIARELLRHKLRSLLSTLGIVFAVVAVVVMLSIAEGAKHETLAQIEQLGTHNIVIRSIPLTEAQVAAARERLSPGLGLHDVAALETGVTSASWVAPLREIRAAVSAADRDGPLPILGVTRAYQSVHDLVVREGRFLDDLDYARRNLVCVLGAEAARRLGSEGRVGGTLRLEDREYRIVGILRQREWSDGKGPALATRNYNRAGFIPLGSAPPAARAADAPAGLSEILVRVRPGSDVRAAAAVVKRILTRTHNGVEDFQIVLPQELLEQARRTQRVFNLVLGGIAGISLLVGGIGIMNVMLAGVAERTSEIGIRRAVGAGREHIVLHYLAEAILLTAVGGCLGLVLGVAGAVAIGALAEWKTVLTPWSMAFPIVMAVGVGLLSGLYPALRAARLDPIAALRC